MCTFIVSISECTQVAVKVFDYPFILRYVNSVQQLALYIIIPIWRCCKVHRSLSQSNSTITPTPQNDHQGINYRPQTNQYNVIPKMNKKQIRIIKPDLEFNDKHHFWFMIYTFFGSISTSSAGMIMNVGLSHITVPTATAMNSFRAVFVLTLSVVFLQFPLKLWNIFAVIVSSLGMLLYVMEVEGNTTDDGNHKDTIFGCSMILIAQFLFSINDIICKKVANYCYHSNRMVMGNILYTIYTSLWSVPLFFWVIWYPDNIFKDTKSFTFYDAIWVFITGFLLIGVHITGYIAITMKSPMYVALGFLLATPMAFLTDVVIHGYTPSYLCILGLFCINT